MKGDSVRETESGQGYEMEGREFQERKRTGPLTKGLSRS
jgi:hypothetical protein